MYVGMLTERSHIEVGMGEILSVCTHCSFYMMLTVKPLTRGQLGTLHFVLSREVILFKRLIFFISAINYLPQTN